MTQIVNYPFNNMETATNLPPCEVCGSKKTTTVTRSMSERNHEKYPEYFKPNMCMNCFNAAARRVVREVWGKEK